MSVQVVMEVAMSASTQRQGIIVLETEFNISVRAGIVEGLGVTKNQCVRNMIAKKCIILFKVGIVLFVTETTIIVHQSAFLKMMMIPQPPNSQSMSK